MTSGLTRRRLLGAAVAGGATGLAGCGRPVADADRTDATTDATDDGGRTGTEAGDSKGKRPPSAVGLDPVLTGLRAPVDVAVAPDADRRYVADQSGRVLVHDPDGARDRPFLDLGEAVEVGGEKGLLGIALHPRFAQNRLAYVRYSAPARAGTPEAYSHTFVLAEFEASPDGTRLRPDSELTVLEIPEPQANHNAGDIAFGPEGLLYVAVGDGGAGGDRGTGHVADWYDAVPGGSGQDVTENLLGGILRIDVDGREGDRGYAVPEANPLVGRQGRDEYFAWGLRNPWRFSFDGGDLYVGDVGQNRFEEVDLVRKGGNYGWNVKEGTHCYGAETCPDRTPADVRGGEPLLDPIVEYPHSGDGVSGVSVIGGYVYRGGRLPGLGGRYVFGDFRANGRLFVATPPAGGDADGHWPTRTVDVEDGLETLFSFGRDAGGELFVLGRRSGETGLYRVRPV